MKSKEINMKGIYALMEWAIDRLKQTSEQRGDWKAKIAEARSSRLRTLKIYKQQIRACRKINLKCPEIELKEKECIEALKRIDILEKKFQAKMN